MSNVTGEFTVALQNRTGADSTVWDSYVAPFQYTTADTPQKVEVTIPLNHTWSTTPVNDNNQGFFLFIAPTGNQTTTTTNAWISGDNLTVTPNTVQWTTTVGNYIEVSQVQLEEGSTATDFEYIPYEVQLLRCQRYYVSSMYPHYNPAAMAGAFTSSAVSSYNFYDRIAFLPTFMRAKPSVTCIAYSTGTKGAYFDRTAGQDVFAAQVGGETNQREIYFYANNTLTVGNLYTWHWTADAEL